MCWRIEQTDIWPLEKKAFDVITANPPYVKSSVHLMPVASYERVLRLAEEKTDFIFTTSRKEGALSEYGGVLLWRQVQDKLMP